MKRLLITFGCSWTYGVGVGYQSGMSDTEFKDLLWNQELCDTHSFRGLLAKKYQAQNINFSSGGSSNQRQFRLAKQFFSSYEFQNLQRSHDQIVVLWGITSTARNELWSNELAQLRDVFYKDKSSKRILQYSYNHQNEVNLLRVEMEHWDDYFNLLGVKNFWYDTFNHHDYWQMYEQEYLQLRQPYWPEWSRFSRQDFTGLDASVLKEIFGAWKHWNKQIVSLPNLIYRNSRPRDLLSQLALKNGLDQPDEQFHASAWHETTVPDNNRIEYLLSLQLVNPVTLHPTQSAHKQLADMISQQIDHVWNL